MFEKTPLDEYNKKLEDFKIKFQIFSDLEEFQKIGRMEVSKEEFYKKQEDEKNDKTEKDKDKEGDKEEYKKKRIKIIKSRKLNKDVKKIKVYAVAEKNEEESDEESEKELDEELEEESEEESEKESNEESEKESNDESEEESEKEQVEEKKYYKYYIFDAGYLQKISRWWWSENRVKTKKYIEEDFSDFMKFLNDVKNLYNAYSLNIYYKKTLTNIHKFISKITPGLYNLKKTYNNNNKIKAQIDSVILTLLDFKNETIINKNIQSSLLSILHQNNKHFIF